MAVLDGCEDTTGPKTSSDVLKTSNVEEYDGGALACISLPAEPSLNDVIESIDDKICDMVDHTHATSEVDTYDGQESFSCLSLTGTLNNVLETLAGEICGLEDTVTALDCSDIEVTSQYSPSCYTPTSTTLCGHLEGIDDKLCAINETTPECLTNNLFSDGDDGTFDTGIANMSSSQCSLFHDTSEAYNGAGSLRAEWDNGGSGEKITHATGMSVTDGNFYDITAYIKISGNVASTEDITLDLDGTGQNAYPFVLQNSTINGSDSWFKLSTRYFPTQTETVNLDINVPGFQETTTIWVDEISIRCEEDPEESEGDDAGGGIAVNDNIADAVAVISNDFVEEGADHSIIDETLTIEDGTYMIDGRRIIISKRDVTLDNTEDNYVYATRNGTYRLRTVTSGGDEPDKNDGDMLIYQITYSGGASTVTDKRVNEPFSADLLQDDSIVGRHIKDGEVSSPKLGDVVTGATVSLPNLTFNDKGQVTAADTDFNISGPTAGEVLVFNGGTGDWENVSVAGNVLPSANADDTMRYDGPADEWQSTSLLKVTSSGVGINTDDTTRSLVLAELTAAGIQMEQPKNPSATLQSGGSLTESQSFFYVITASDGVGETVVSDEVSETTDATNKTIALSWDEVRGAQSYFVYRGTSSGGQDERFEVTTNSYTDDGTDTFTAETTPSSTDAFVVSLHSTSDSHIFSGLKTEALEVLGRMLIKNKVSGVDSDVNSEGRNIVGFNQTSARKLTIDSDDISQDGYFIVVNDEGGNAGTNTITIETEGSETIDGSASVTITTDNDSLRLYSDGSNLFTF